VSSVAAHHGGASECATKAHSSPEAQLTAASGHDCGAHRDARHEVTTAAQRADSKVSAPLAVVSNVPITLSALHGILDGRAPSDTAPNTAIPLILRV
jgi:hypothetical protein